MSRSTTEASLGRATENLLRALVALGVAAEKLSRSTGGASRTAIVSARSAGRKAAGLARPFAASRSAL